MATIVVTLEKGASPRVAIDAALSECSGVLTTVAALLPSLRLASAIRADGKGRGIGKQDAPPERLSRTQAQR
jgi:hypothetical protein